jgi:hypothetical protein
VLCRIWPTAFCGPWLDIRTPPFAAFFVEHAPLYGCWTRPMARQRPPLVHGHQMGSDGRAARSDETKPADRPGALTLAPFRPLATLCLCPTCPATATGEAGAPALVGRRLRQHTPPQPLPISPFSFLSASVPYANGGGAWRRASVPDGDAKVGRPASSPACTTSEDDGWVARPLPPKGSFPFSGGEGEVPPPPVFFFRRLGLPMRVMIERNGTASWRHTLPASSRLRSGKFIFPLLPSVILYSGFFWG